MPPLADSLYPSWPPLPPAPDPSPTVFTLESFTLPLFSFPSLSSDSATSTLSSALTSPFIPTPATSASTSTQPSPRESADIDESNAAALFQLRTALYLLIVGCVSLVIIILLHGYLYYQWRRQRADNTVVTATTLKTVDSTSDQSSFASPGSIFPRMPSDVEAVENGSVPSIEPTSARTFDFRCQGGSTTVASSFPSSLSILARPRTTRDRGTQTEMKHCRRRGPASIETLTSTQPNSPTNPSYSCRDTVGRIVAAYSYHQSDRTSVSSPNASSRFHPEYTTTSSSSQTDRDGPTLTLQFPTPPSTGLPAFAPLDARALSRAGRNSPFSESDQGKRDRRRGREGGSREDNAMLEQFLRSVVLDGEGGRESAIRTISHSSAGAEEGRWWFV